MSMLWYIQNANINIQSKFHGSTMFSFRVTPKTKIDFVFKTTGKFLTHITLVKKKMWFHIAGNIHIIYLYTCTLTLRSLRILSQIRLERGIIFPYKMI
ncbi:Uncharacterized protein FWK35_00030268 [Aphis craccivora]|uniref:Uncharacterized protein n=1 Tax=Aphis craccivora TaxID=307492 RepID=A0A6G0VQ79_APHCR|nr:Uncharacterized protein FWK35_00030268 [Aphis craccivora]